MSYPELFPELTGVVLAAVGEWQIGKSGVLARETPGTLTVPCEVNNWPRFTHDFVSFKCVVVRMATANW
jgi:hypothetical protein